MNHNYVPSSQYGSVHNNKFVDINGRLVAVVEDEYSGEIYVSLSELKKSGFELFEAGSLPKPGGYLHNMNALQIDQFDCYMRMKAAKYLSRSVVMLRKDHTEKLIKEQKEHYKLGDRTVKYNTKGNFSITANVQGSPKSISNNFELNTNNKNSNRDHLNQNRQPQQQQYQSKHRSFNSERNGTYRSRKSSEDESMVSFSNSRPLTKNNESKPTERLSLNVPNQMQLPRSPPTYSKPKQSNSGYCYKPEPMSDKLPCKPQNSEPFSPITSSEGKLNNAQEGKVSNSGFGSMTSSTPVPSPVSKRIEQEKASKRSCTAEVVCQGGIFEYISTIDDNNIIVFVVPLNYTSEMVTLQNIDEECKDDPNFAPAVGDMIAVFYDTEDTYVRGIVSKIVDGNYTCSLIDFGVIITSTKIRPLLRRFMEIPEFVCCVTGNADSINEIKKGGNAIRYDITSSGEITLLIDPSQKVHKVQAKVWNYLNDITKTDIPEPVQVFKVPEPKNHLTPGDIVIIVSQVDGSLILRTKECNKLLKEVNQAIEGHQTEAVAGTPVVNQLVLCPYSSDDSNSLYRAEVLSVDGQFGNVRYTDYGDSDKVLISSFKTVNETLASISNTYIAITLQEFDNKIFTSKQLSFLGDCCNRREKFTVISKGDTKVFDLLFADKTSLSKKLIDLEKPPTPPVIMEPVKVPISVSKPIEEEKIYSIQSLKDCELKIGMNRVLCLSTSEAPDGISSFCPSTDEVVTRLSEITELINDHVASDHTPYQPKLLALCLAKYEDDWCRGAVMDVVDDGFLIYFVDYGNTSLVKFNDIRKISEKLAAYQSCSAVCVFKDLNKDGSADIKEPLLSKLLNHLKESEEYEINVLGKTEEAYDITIPSVYDKLKEEGVL